MLPCKLCNCTICIPPCKSYSRTPKCRNFPNFSRDQNWSKCENFGDHWPPRPLQGTHNASVTVARAGPPTLHGPPSTVGALVGRLRGLRGFSGGRPGVKKSNIFDKFQPFFIFILGVETDLLEVQIGGKTRFLAPMAPKTAILRLPPLP